MNKTISQFKSNLSRFCFQKGDRKTTELFLLLEEIYLNWDINFDEKHKVLYGNIHYF